MAKLSSINKNERRKKLVEKNAAKYAKLKAIANDESRDETERLIARLKMAELPRNGNPTRVRNRCELTGRVARLLSQVPLVADHASGPGQQGPDPRRHQVELVRAAGMAMTDPLGDMLTRIRNGQQARKDSILTPASKLRAHVLDVLQREGYIRGYSEEELAGQKGLRIELKYFEGQPAIQHLARVSKPGRRVYSGAQELPRIRNGLGTVIVSTPRGVLSDAEAREANVGGEVLAEVF